MPFNDYDDIPPDTAELIFDKLNERDLGEVADFLSEVLSDLEHVEQEWDRLTNARQQLGYVVRRMKEELL